MHSLTRHTCDCFLITISIGSVSRYASHFPEKSRRPTHQRPMQPSARADRQGAQAKKLLPHVAPKLVLPLGAGRRDSNAARSLVRRWQGNLARHARSPACIAHTAQSLAAIPSDCRYLFDQDEPISTLAFALFSSSIRRRWPSVCLHAAAPAATRRQLLRGRPRPRLGLWRRRWRKVFHAGQRHAAWLVESVSLLGFRPSLRPLQSVGVESPSGSRQVVSRDRDDVPVGLTEGTMQASSNPKHPATHPRRRPRSRHTPDSP